MRYLEFLRTLPAVVIPNLPPPMQNIKFRQPYRWLAQFHYGEPRLHYEVSRSRGRPDLELAFHCESRDKHLNRLLLAGFRRHLFEIKDTLGESFEAEMWDKGWTKMYEVHALEELTPEYQGAVGQRLAEIIICIHPIYVELRSQVQRIYR
ncbi:MAG: hypothetical protein BMS9Abin02_0767 [Anaerolineae bacterium]|nr:MAG: hypothetical protein BMS9Abin02_0767 [Anaerolineae bacterium]